MNGTSQISPARCLGALFVALVIFASPAGAATFEIGAKDFLLNGKPFLIKAGEMHPARIPHEYWAQRLRTMHAMGLNTVSVYVFWNLHEPQEGKFNFAGDADIAEFVRLAQQEGLWVLLRPGPYCCAEWEFGGFPWWLLRQPDLKVRGQDPRFLRAAGNYLRQLGKQLAPLQITRGGPIIMVQVENEYGSFGSDHEYMRKILELDRAAGFEVPFFTSDGGGNMMAGGQISEALPGLNGGSGPGIMKEIGKYRPTGPWFVPELYPGWLDHWGEPHAQVGIDGLVRDTEWKLTNNVSFCYYMIHGGTSFGFWSGANYGGKFQPQPTSYDYDAPMDEMGRPTEKFFALQQVLARHRAPGESFPELPAATPVIEIPPVHFTAADSVFALLGKPVKSAAPLGFEELNQGYGYVLYRTKVAAPDATTLKLGKLRDYAVVCVNQNRRATLDRRNRQDAVTLTNAVGTLELLVENGGRINYGRQLLDNRKGLLGSITLGVQELSHWEMFRLPFDQPPKLKRGIRTERAPFVARATFELSAVGDTFLDLRGWGKGIVFVNGHNLGRYWYIGPQQTLYCPGVWLKKGRNEIVVFEQIKDGLRSVAGLKTPILDQLNADENAPIAPKAEPKPAPVVVRPQVAAPKLSAATLVQSGPLADGDDEQVVKFPARRARYLALQALSSHNGDEFTTLAELSAIDAAGKVLAPTAWKVAYVDSEENLAEGGQAELAFDGDRDTFWHTLWSAPHPGHPHVLVIDLGAEFEIAGIRLLPRQDSANGHIKDYQLHLCATPF